MIGRPKTLADSVPVNIRMEGATKAALEHEAHELGVSVSNRIRRIVEDYFNGKTPMVPVLRR